MRVEVTTSRTSPWPSSSKESQGAYVVLGVLSVETEAVSELNAEVPVARLRGDAEADGELLPPLVDAKITELSDSRFALTGMEIRGASRFAQAWYCEVRVTHADVSPVL
ncbi:conserved protein of unknown function (plasmid) [Pararobbsia alpina]